MKARAVPDTQPTVAAQVEDGRERVEEMLAEQDGGDPSLGIDMEPATTYVRRKYKDTSGIGTEEESEDEEPLAVEGFVVEPAEVWVSKSVTINLGNFASAKVEIGIRMPCYSEEASEAFEHALKFVDTRLEREKNDARNWATMRSPHKRKDPLGVPPRSTDVDADAAPF